MTTGHFEGIDPSRVVLHIGLHKTGTTYLQKKIFPQLKVDLLIQPDVIYLAKEERYDAAQFCAQMEPLRQKKGHNQLIFSQETLSGRGDGNPIWDPVRMAERLHATFPEAKVVFTLREQFAYILSLYRFRVIQRGLERNGIDAYLEEKYEKRLKQKMAYHHLVQTYLRLFGADRLLLLTYEGFVKDRERFLTRLYDFIGSEERPPGVDERVNAGVQDHFFLEINRRINYPVSAITDFLRRNNIMSQRAYEAFAARYFQMKSMLLFPVLKRLPLPKRPVEFPSQWQERMRNDFASSNRSLMELVDIDLAADDYSI